MSTGKRPLSPHLQVYRPQITSVLSILHRFAGIVLALGTLHLVYWIVAAAGGAETFAAAQAFTASWLGRLLLFGWTIALFYHLTNGIRHLLWDAGFGFELHQVTLSGVAVLIATAVLTVVAWMAGYGLIGGLS